jgi:hypothetical protein
LDRPVKPADPPNIILEHGFADAPRAGSSETTAVLSAAYDLKQLRV